MLPLLLRITRGCPGSTIRLEGLFRSDLALKRAIHKGSPDVQALAWQRIHSIWRLLGDLCMLATCKAKEKGCTCGSTTSST